MKKLFLGISALLAVAALASCSAPTKKETSNPDNSIAEASESRSHSEASPTIVRADKDSSTKGVEVYTLIYSDGSQKQFVVVTGSDGGVGAQGIKDENGNVPAITIGENGNWFVDGVDSGVKSKGDADEKLSSAYEVYCKNHPEYKGDEEQWLKDLASDNLNNLIISFDTDGGTAMDPISLDPGSFLFVDSPTRNGYEFVGWTLNGADIDLRTYVFQASCTLKAKWKIITYRITYVLDEGSNDSGNPTSYDVETEDIALKDPSKAGFDFGGWYKDGTFSEEVDKILKGSYGDITLYAKWIEGTSPSDSPIIKTPTTITLWHSFTRARTELLDTFLEKFKEKEPNITVVSEAQGGYDDAFEHVMNGFSPDIYPDLVFAYPDNIAEFISREKVVDLDSYISNAVYGWNEAEKSGIYENILSLGSQYSEKGTYSLPYHLTTECLYYNADVLLNLDLSSVDATINDGKPLDASYLDNLTWEELFDKLCPAIRTYDSSLGSDGIVGFDSDADLILTLAKQYGIGYTSIDEETGKGKFDFGVGEDKENMAALLKKWASYSEKGYLTSKSKTGFYISTLFSQGKTLFYLATTPNKSYIDENIGVGEAKIPHAAGKAQYSLASGANITMLDHEDYNRKVASWLLMKDFLSEEASLERSKQYGYTDIHKSSSAKDLYQNRVDVISSLFDYPHFVGSDTARQGISGVMARIVKSPSEVKENVDTWLDDAYKACVEAAK